MSRIVFIGDSIVKGTDYGGVTSSQCFAAKIGAAAGYVSTDVVNAGVSGNTSADILARLQSDVIAQTPAVCAILIGINDWSKGVIPAQYQANLNSILDILDQNGIKPVLMSSNLQRGQTADIANFLPYLKVVDAISSGRRVSYIDLYREVCAAYLYLDGPTWTGLYADGVVHLSVAGHQFVADLAARPRYAGFFKAASNPSPDDVRNLTVALADYVINGVNGATVQNVISSRSKF